MKGRIIGLSSLIKYKFLKHKFKNQYKFTNASDPAVINTVIQYLIDGPIKLQQTILSQIDDTVAATNNHIGSLKQLIKELSSGDLLSGEIILESRISMANSCIDKLNIQLQELSVQKTDASNAIIPIKKMAKDLGVLNKSNNTIKTIQEALNITEFNTMIIEQNYQLISDLNIVCDNTINTLKDIQVHKISRSNAEEEITKLTIGAR